MSRLQHKKFTTPFPQRLNDGHRSEQLLLEQLSILGAVGLKIGTLPDLPFTEPRIQHRSKNKDGYWTFIAPDLCVILPATASNPDKEILYIQCKKKELKGTTDQHYLLDEKQLHLLSKSEQYLGRTILVVHNTIIQNQDQWLFVEYKKLATINLLKSTINKKPTFKIPLTTFSPLLSLIERK